MAQQNELAEYSAPTLAPSMIENGQAMQQVQSRYTTALAVQRPREIAVVESRLMQEADQAGEDFWYGWGAGKNRVEGPSVGLALAAARCFGNCVLEQEPVQDIPGAWVFTAHFVDLETGFTLSRQFRQSKTWTVHGKMDDERKIDMRFQIGQSKAIRNVIRDAVPKWLLSKAIERAKGGVRDKVQGLVDQYGIEKVIDTAVEKLGAHGADSDRILAKFGRPTIGALTVEDLVLIRGDLNVLDGNQDTVNNLYPAPPAPPALNSATVGGATADDLLTPKAAKKTPPKTGKKTGKKKTEPAQQAANETTETPPDSSEAEQHEPEPPELSPAFRDLNARINGCESKEAYLSAKQQLTADKSSLTEDEHAYLEGAIEQGIAALSN